MVDKEPMRLIDAFDAANPSEQLGEGAACPKKTNGLHVAAKGLKSDKNPVAPAGRGNVFVAAFGFKGSTA